MSEPTPDEGAEEYELDEDIDPTQHAENEARSDEHADEEVVDP